jgi:phosphoserine phosphatase RsbU/P
LVFREADGKRYLKEQLHPTGAAIGLMANADYHLAETQLLAGDFLYTFTDGVIESRNSMGDEFGLERLIALIEESNDPTKSTLQAIEKAMHIHSNNAEAFDDVTMLAIRRFRAEEE